MLRILDFASSPERCSAGGTAYSIATGDLNNDGRRDLVLPGGTGQDLSILLMGCE